MEIVELIQINPKIIEELRTLDGFFYKLYSNIPVANSTFTDCPKYFPKYNILLAISLYSVCHF